MITVEEINQAVEAIVNGKQTQLLVDDLNEVLQQNEEQVRDFIRQAFIDLGIEVEFSGKGLQERGVVIDIDTERVNELGIDPDILRFGQTLVKHKQ